MKQMLLALIVAIVFGQVTAIEDETMFKILNFVHEIDFRSNKTHVCHWKPTTNSGDIQLKWSCQHIKNEEDKDHMSTILKCLDLDWQTYKSKDVFVVTCIIGVLFSSFVFSWLCWAILLCCTR